MQQCEDCGKPSENKLCTECLTKAMHGFEDEEKCHNCDEKCAGCSYDFDDDSTKLDENELNENK